MQLYASPYSELLYVKESHSLWAVWLQESKKMVETQVKFEISQILIFVLKLKIKKIVVDTRNYVFNETRELQNWISQIYIPQIMNSGVLKYAIITNTQVSQKLAFLPVPDEVMMIEYFNNPEDAKIWINT